MWFLVVLLRVVLLLMLVAAFAMGITALARNTETDTTLNEPKLIHPGGENVGTTVPSVVVSGGTLGFGSPTMAPGSTDTSGGIGGTTTAATGQLTVTFGTPYATIPKAVLLTPSFVTPYTVPLFVVNLTKTGFVVQGTPTNAVSTPSAFPLFFYLVL